MSSTLKHKRNDIETIGRDGILEKGRDSGG